MPLFAVLSRFSHPLVVLSITVASLGVGLGLGLSLGATGILAGHDDPDVIHACVDNETGDVRIVENPDECDTIAENQSRTRRGDLQEPERVLEWNQKGPTGPVGPQGPQGEPGLDWRGPWDSTLRYRIDDAVSYQGSSYVAVADSTGEEPGTGSSWELLASQGEQGPEGPQGPQGPEGPQGPPGFSNYNVITGSVTIPNGSTGISNLVCPEGQKAMSGGWTHGTETSTDVEGFTISWSRPAPDTERGWQIVGANVTGAEKSLTTYAVCINVAE